MANKKTPSALWLLHPLLIPLSLGYGVVLLQLIPIPGGIIRLVSPKTAWVYSLAFHGLDSHWSPWRFYRLTLWPEETVAQLVQLTVCLVALIMAGDLFANTTSLRRLAMWMMLIGFAVGAMAVAQEIWTPGKIFGFWESIRGGTPIGPFINRNHFASYMTLTTGVAFGVMFYALHLFRLRRSSSGARLLVAVIPCVAFMSTSIIISRSRGGMVGFGAALIVLLALTGYSKRSWRWTLYALAIAAPFVLAGGIALGKEMFERFRGLSEERITRLYVWRNTLRMAVRYPVFGAGLGTFPRVYPISQIPPTSLGPEPFATNEYLQALAETGLVGFGAIILMGAIWARWICRALRAHADSPERWLLIGIASGLAGMATHSAFDFILHVPANAFAFAVLLGGSFGVSRRWTGTEGETEAIMKRGWGKVATALFIGLFILIACEAVRRYQAESLQLRCERVMNKLRKEALEPTAAEAQLLFAAIHAAPFNGENRKYLAELFSYFAQAEVEAFLRPYPALRAARAAALARAASLQYQAAIRLSPSWSEFHLRYGLFCAWASGVGLERWENLAEKEFEKAAEFDPINPETAYTIGNHYLRHRLGGREIAAKWFYRSLAESGHYSREIFQALDIPSADIEYWARHVPPVARRWYELARFLESKNRKDLSCEALAKACAFAENEKTWVKEALLGDLLKHDPGATIAWAARWVKRRPQALELRLILLRAQLAAGRHAEAVATARAILEIKADPAMAAQVAQTMQSAGQPQLAIPLLRELEGRHPAEPRIPAILGALHSSAGQFEDAIQSFERAIRKNPLADTHYFALAALYTERGQIENAQAVYLRLLKADPLNAEAWFRLGQSYEVVGKMPLALSCYEKASKLQPGSTEYRQALTRAKSNHPRE